MRFALLILLASPATGAERFEVDPALSLRLAAAGAFLTSDRAPARLVRAFEKAPDALLGERGWLAFVERARRTKPVGRVAEGRTEEVLEAVFERLRQVGELHAELDREVITVVVSRKRVVFEWPKGARMAFAIKPRPDGTALWVRTRGRPGRLPWYFAARRRGDRIELRAPTGDRLALTKLKRAHATGPLSVRQRKLRALEVQPILRRMYDGAVAQWRRSKRFPDGAGPVPAKPPECKGRRPASSEPAFDHPTWATLGLVAPGPVLFQYEFESSAKAFTARATGDLDCDGVRSTFEYRGTVGERGRIDAHGGLVRTRPLE